MTERKLDVRDTLFGDLPISQWARDSNPEADRQPWESFRQAKRLWDAGDTQAASQILNQVATMPDLESRHYLQAWHFLRILGHIPTDREGRMLLGVVVEVGMAKGTDLVAAYADHHARYYNYSGAGVVWERPTAQLNLITE